MDVKKILIVIGFIIFVVAVGFALYWVFFRSPVTPEGPEGNLNEGVFPTIGEGNVSIVTNESVTENLPWENYLEGRVAEVANGGLTAVSEVVGNEVNGLTLAPDGLKFYDADKKQFYKINKQGEHELLTDDKFYGVENIVWAEHNNKAILEYPDGSNIVYDFDKDKQYSLPIELQDFSFNPNGSRIAAEWMDPYGNDDNNWLVAMNDDGSGLALIEPLGDEDINTDIGFSPDNQIVALHRKYTGVQTQEVYPIGLHGENFKSFNVQGAGFTSEWSPSGNTLLYSVYHKDTNYLPNLWVTQGGTGELGRLKVSLNVATWPEKCTFSGESTVYCAVPRGLPTGAGLYPEVADGYSDVFYQIDLTSGVQTLLADPVGASGSYTANSLFVSDDGGFLYFIDQDGSLQSIRLQ